MNFFVTARRWQKGGGRHKQNKQNDQRGRGRGRNIYYNFSFQV